MKLQEDFYLRPDVISIAKELLGKTLLTRIDRKLTTGIIVETEAYKAPEDKASHAFGNKKTKRTEVFFKKGGVSYVYLCYGIHHLFNIVTNQKEIPHAILVRAIEPIEGINYMLKRRGKKEKNYTLSSGPGSMSRAMGITIQHNALSLQGDQVWLEDEGIKVLPQEIVCSSRVGVSYAEEYALKPWRFSLKSSPWVSKPKPEQ